MGKSLAAPVRLLLLRTGAMNEVAMAIYTIDEELDRLQAGLVRVRQVFA